MQNITQHKEKYCKRNKFSTQSPLNAPISMGKENFHTKI